MNGGAVLERLDHDRDASQRLIAHDHHATRMCEAHVALHVAARAAHIHRLCLHGVHALQIFRLPFDLHGRGHDADAAQEEPGGDLAIELRNHRHALATGDARHRHADLGGLRLHPHARDLFGLTVDRHQQGLRRDIPSGALQADGGLHRRHALNRRGGAADPHLRRRGHAVADLGAETGHRRAVHPDHDRQTRGDQRIEPDGHGFRGHSIDFDGGI